MALFPKRVDIDEASIKQLVKLYRDAYKYVRHTIFETGNRSVTIISVGQARLLIQQRLQQLAREASGWAGEQIPRMYDRGQQDAVAELRSFHDPRTDAIAAAIALGTLRLSQLHDEAVQTQTTELTNRLNEATNTMYRSADKTLSQLLRQSIANRIDRTEGLATRQELRRQVLQAFDENGVYGLLDASGKRWSPHVYADMVSRTLSAQTRNTALSNSLRSQGYDLVRVSAHGASDACREWEDAILSLSGETPGYFTVDDATGAGLFHVNCQHSLDPVDVNDYPPEYLPAGTTQDQLDILTIDEE